MRRFFASSAAAILLVAAISGFSAQPCRAAVESGLSFGHVAKAWMGAVALLAQDDDGQRGGRPRGGPGPRPGMEGPRVAMAKMDEILDRLSRIEAKLDGRAGGPPRGDWRGPRPPWGGPGSRPERRAEVPEEAREQMRKRMEEGRERMEQARQKFRAMEERISKLEAEIERLKNPTTAQQ